MVSMNPYLNFSQLSPMSPHLKEASSVCRDAGNLDVWQEEKKQWMAAAGVDTPAGLELKIADLSKVAERRDVELRTLACHLMEVKTFLGSLAELDRVLRKRKRRFQRSTWPTRDGSQESCGESCNGACCKDGDICTCVLIARGSRLKRFKPTKASDSLLDPSIMRSFRSLIAGRADASSQQRRAPECAPWNRSEDDGVPEDVWYGSPSWLADKC